MADTDGGTPRPPHTDDIAAVLETLRAEVKAQRQGAPVAERTPLQQQLDRAIEQVEITRVVSAHWPLEGRNPFERALLAVHKIVRRSLRWYINPIVEQQNAFNDTAARALHLLAESYTSPQAIQDHRRD
jgi:hypothetical protein